MNIRGGLRKEATKLEQQLESIQEAITDLGGRNSVGRGNSQKKRHVSAVARDKTRTCAVCWKESTRLRRGKCLNIEAAWRGRGGIPGDRGLVRERSHRDGTDRKVESGAK